MESISKSSVEQVDLLTNGAIMNGMQHPKATLSFMDFCAGIGGGRLGLEKNKFLSVGFSEIDKLARLSYQSMHKIGNEVFFEDLTKIDVSQLPDFDVMIAGFPCQTFSVIGQRQGMQDDRGQIIYSLVEIAKSKLVPYFILENVKGLVSHDNGRTIKTILTLLQDSNYHVEYKILNSLDYGVPQMRERVYFVGIRRDLYNQNSAQFVWPTKIAPPCLTQYLIDTNNELSHQQLDTFQRYLNNKYNQGKYTLQDIAKSEYTVVDTRQSDLRIYQDKVPTIRKGRQGIFYIRDDKLRNLTGYEGMLLQGFDKSYADLIKNKVANSVLLGQVGNAMTVTVIDAIAQSLLKYIGI
jgi:DNA (cytosine-5)-methyltransferase 1